MSAETQSVTDVATQIRTFIVDELLFGDASSLPDDDSSLLLNGVIDSTDVLELIVFIERVFAFEVPDTDVVPDNFDTVNGLARYVRSNVN
jgi:acyl carrier protein